MWNYLDRHIYIEPHPYDRKNDFRWIRIKTEIRGYRLVLGVTTWETYHGHHVQVEEMDGGKYVITPCDYTITDTLHNTITWNDVPMLDDPE